MPGSTPGWGKLWCCVVGQDNIFSASLHARVLMGTRKFNGRGNP